MRLSALMIGGFASMVFWGLILALLVYLAP